MTIFCVSTVVVVHATVEEDPVHHFSTRNTVLYCKSRFLELKSNVSHAPLRLHQKVTQPSCSRLLGNIVLSLQVDAHAYTFHFAKSLDTRRRWFRFQKIITQLQSHFFFHSVLFYFLHHILFNPLKSYLKPSLIGSMRTVRPSAKVNPRPPTTTGVDRQSLDYAGSVLRTRLEIPLSFSRMIHRKYVLDYVYAVLHWHWTHSGATFPIVSRATGEMVSREEVLSKFEWIWKSTTPSLCSIVLRFV